MKRWKALAATCVLVGLVAVPHFAGAYKINDQIEVGLDLRWRGVCFDNVWDLDDDNNSDSWTFHRARSRVWADLSPLPTLHGYIRLANETRWGQDDEILGDVGEKSDVFLDNAFIEVKDVFDLPVDFKVGRQDLMYGEGFMFLDGCCQVGSTSIAFDAAKLTYKGIENTSIDLLIAKPFENAEKAADDEDVYGIYAKTKVKDNVGLEPYVLYKNRRSRRNITGGPVDYTRPKSKTLALGMRGTFSPLENVSCVAEAVYQDREWTPEPVQPGPTAAPTVDDSEQMFGGYVRGTYTFAAQQWRPRVWGEFVHLPADWDSMYAEWPKYSELLIYTLYDGFNFATGANDPDEGAWVNMQIYSAGVGCTPTAKTDLSLTYRKLMAISENGPGSDESDRGDLLAVLAKHSFNEYLSSHALLEWFTPGDYYGSSADDAYFARFELYFRY